MGEATLEYKEKALMGAVEHIKEYLDKALRCVANVATLQLAATCPNFEILEIMYCDVEWRKDVTNEDLEYNDGYITIPDKPGLGIEINEEECLKHPYQSHTLRHYTDALTDIRPTKTEFYF